MKYFTRILLLAFYVGSVGVIAQNVPGPLDAKIRRFAPTKITASTSKLSSGDNKALKKLIEAARWMDSMYLRQAWNGNIDLLSKLRTDKSSNGKKLFQYFLINMGPWSRLDHDEPFIDGTPQKPVGATYYPEGILKDSIEKWIAALPEEQKMKATGYFWTIRTDQNGHLYTRPYNEEYQEFLQPAAQLLKEAAELTTNQSLKNFLSKRADAFLSNNYFESDVAWMDLDSPIEPTIGPYEVYMDEMFNYKAAFEAFITLRNEAETKKLSKFSSYLQEVENNLPIDPKYRNPKLGAFSPIRVVDEVVVGGEARAGVQTAAFNLPNDEKVVAEKGSKRVMLKNVQKAKFNKALKPIAAVTIEKSQLPMIDFELFFTHILAHELMHGLGPQVITVDGKQTTVRQQMKELGSALEEAKADISGLFALQYFINKGILPKSSEQKLYVTYLASAFRTVRFGLNESHGKGIALQFNYLSDEGAFIYNQHDGTFSVDFTKIKPAVEKLTHDIMTIQAEGSYEKAKALLENYVLIRPEMNVSLDKLTDVPVDIAPNFPLAEQQ